MFSDESDVEWVDEEDMEDDTDTEDDDNEPQQEQNGGEHIQLREIVIQPRNVSTTKTIILPCRFELENKII